MTIGLWCIFCNSWSCVVWLSYW